jgi:hypothetical protein
MKFVPAIAILASQMEMSWFQRLTEEAPLAGEPADLRLVMNPLAEFSVKE